MALAFSKFPFNCIQSEASIVRLVSTPYLPVRSWVAFRVSVNQIKSFPSLEMFLKNNHQHVYKPLGNISIKQESTQEIMSDIEDGMNEAEAVQKFLDENEEPKD